MPKGIIYFCLFDFPLEIPPGDCLPHFWSTFDLFLPSVSLEKHPKCVIYISGDVLRLENSHPERFFYVKIVCENILSVALERTAILEFFQEPPSTRHTPINYCIFPLKYTKFPLDFTINHQWDDQDTHRWPIDGVLRQENCRKIELFSLQLTTNQSQWLQLKTQQKISDLLPITSTCGAGITKEGRKISQKNFTDVQKYPSFWRKQREKNQASRESCRNFVKNPCLWVFWWILCYS